MEKHVEETELTKEEKSRRVVNIVTHNERFHADEVFAIAMFMVYYGDDTVVKVNRIPHCNSFEEVCDRMIESGLITTPEEIDIVIDTGRGLGYNAEYEVLLLDHHQYEGGLASTGLSFDSIVNKLGDKRFDHPEIKTMVDNIDKTDTGVNIGNVGDFSYIINKMAENANFDSSLDMDTQFMYAVSMAKNVINAIIKQQESVDKYVSIINNADFIEGTNVKIVREPLGGWSRIVNSGLLCNDTVVEAIMTIKDNGKCILKTVPLKEFSYQKVGRSLPEDSNIEFVHKAGFIATDSREDKMVEYIKKYFRISKLSSEYSLKPYQATYLPSLKEVNIKYLESFLNGDVDLSDGAILIIDNLSNTYMVLENRTIIIKETLLDIILYDSSMSDSELSESNIVEEFIVSLWWHSKKTIPEEVETVKKDLED